MKKLISIILVSFLLLQPGYTEDHSVSIRFIDFKNFLIQRDQLEKTLRPDFPEEYCPDLIKDIGVSYGKLIGKSTEQAVAEAITCAMGNGGANSVSI